MGLLLEEFRLGKIADRDRELEDQAIRTYLEEHGRAWNIVLPEFPAYSEKRRTLIREFKRGRKDAYLRRLIVNTLAGYDAENRLIVNPATVIGRHAKFLAAELPHYQIVGTDIDSRADAFCGFFSFKRHKNYRFVRENVFEPDMDRKPAAIVFFGACGSVSDGAIEYGIAVDSPFLIFRTCCHENICGNTEIVRRRSIINRFFAMKNWGFAKYKKKDQGFYFTDSYDKNAYPRSNAAREIADSDTFLRVAKNAVDSDICRTIIDLDRVMHLQENGYDVLYREEVFFAHKRCESSSPQPTGGR